jgi:hypothetical protein
MDPYVMLLNVPYVGLYALVNRYIPSFITPTFVSGLGSLVVIQTAILSFPMAPLWTRALLLLVFLLAWVFLLVSMITQIVCGKDIVRLGCSFLRTEQETRTNDTNDGQTLSV